MVPVLTLITWLFVSAMPFFLNEQMTEIFIFQLIGYFITIKILSVIPACITSIVFCSFDALHSLKGDVLWKDLDSQLFDSCPFHCTRAAINTVYGHKYGMKS